MDFEIMSMDVGSKNIKADVLTMADFPASLAIYRASKQDFPCLSEKSFCDALARNLRRGSVLGVHCGGELAGIIVFSPPLSRISFLAVHPAFRRRGIGRILTEAALSRLNGSAELFTYAQANPQTPGAAYCLYRSLGFVEVGKVSGYAAPVICMRKTNSK